MSCLLRPHGLCSNMYYQFAANAVICLHFAFVLYALAGGVLRSH